jgi:hypothetical protein
MTTHSFSISLTKQIRALLGLAAILCLGGLSAWADPQYFYSTPGHAETGYSLGSSVGGNPLTWASLHSQFTGDVVSNRLRLGNVPKANWTFLWTRDKSDTATYKLVPTFTVEKEFKGTIGIQVGFDGVFDHVQIPWPKGYWVSSEDEWNEPMAVTPADPGTYTLTRDSVTVPRIISKIYVRIIVLSSPQPGQFALIDSGSVTFAPSN